LKTIEEKGKLEIYEWLWEQFFLLFQDKSGEDGRKPVTKG
jgi:hypothetical protein